MGKSQPLDHINQLSLAKNDDSDANGDYNVDDNSDANEDELNTHSLERYLSL